MEHATTKNIEMIIEVLRKGFHTNTNPFQNEAIAREADQSRLARASNPTKSLFPEIKPILRAVLASEVSLLAT
jgi:hypothetical protein